MDSESNGGSTSKTNGALAEILSELAAIQGRLGTIGKAIRNLDFNIRALQGAYQQTSAQVRLVQRRCENREQLIKDFLSALECSGPPRRDTPTCDLPLAQISADPEPASNDG